MPGSCPLPILSLSDKAGQGEIAYLVLRAPQGEKRRTQGDATLKLAFGTTAILTAFEESELVSTALVLLVDMRKLLLSVHATENKAEDRTARLNC